jgi:short-subunit dehydrogenase
MNPQNIFVTGATGFIGQSLVACLKKRYPASHLTLLVRTPYTIPGCETIVADAIDIEKYRTQLIEADVVFHLAANAQFGSQFDYQKENVEPLKQMVSAITASSRQHDIHFIFVSTIGAFDRSPSDKLTFPIDNHSIPNPRSAYGRSKLDGEIVLKNAGIKYTIVRPSWVYGLGMRSDSHVCAFATMLENSRFLARFSFPGKVSLVHVDDLAEGLARIPDHAGALNNEYFVATEERSIGEILKSLDSQIHGPPINQFYVPAFFAIRIMHAMLPLQITNLFYPYLTCESESFWKSTAYSPQKKWVEYCQDVANSTSRRRKYVVITGANSGIGLALAQNFLKEGRKLVLIDKQISQIGHLAGSSTKIIKTDLSNKSEVIDLVETLRAFEIAILINNAGIGVRGDFSDITFDNIQSMASVNILAPLLLTRGLLPNLKKTKAAIVNITSSTAIHPLPHMAIYAATKSFLRNWSLALSEEIKSTNHVLTFAPSGTRTGFQLAAGVKINDSQNLQTPDFVADQIQTAICKKYLSVSLGHAAFILNCVSFFIPMRSRLKLWSFLFRKQR